MTHFLPGMTYWKRVDRLNELRRRAERTSADLYDAIREHETITGEELRFGHSTRTPPVPLDWHHFGKTESGVVG